MKISSVFTLLLSAALSTIAAPPNLTTDGIEIDGGTMGGFTFRYPKFHLGGKEIAPQVKKAGARATLSYPAPHAPHIELALDDGRRSIKLLRYGLGRILIEGQDALLHPAGLPVIALGCGYRHAINGKQRGTEPHSIALQLSLNRGIGR